MLEGLLAAFLSARRSELRDAPIEELAFVTYHALDGVVEGALLLEPALLGSDALRREIFHLLWRFVAPEGADPSVPAEPHARASPAPEPRTDAGVRARFDAEPSHRRVVGARTPQGAASATRRAILDATAKLLASEGLARLSARKVARAAGVAPGTIYHHFRNIESIVAELRREHELTLRAAIAAAAPKLGDVDLRRAIEAIVRLYAGTDGAEQRLQRALLAEVPRRWAEQASLEAQRIARRKLAAAMAARSDVRPGDHELMVFVASRATEGVVEAAMLRDIDWLHPARLVEVLVELLHRYLRADAPRT